LQRTVENIEDPYQLGFSPDHKLLNVISTGTNGVTIIETATGVRRHADPLGFFFDFTGSAALEGGGALPDSLKGELRKGAEASAAAYAKLAEFLEVELTPKASEQAEQRKWRRFNQKCHVTVQRQRERMCVLACLN